MSNILEKYIVWTKLDMKTEEVRPPRQWCHEFVPVSGQRQQDDGFSRENDERDSHSGADVETKNQTL